MNNSAIADQFSLLSKLMDIHGENSFKSKTYSIAAFHIERLPEPLAGTPRNEIANIKGLGPGVAAKVAELLDTGAMQALQELLQSTPEGVLEILNLKGLGPKKINIIWKEMEIDSIGELEYACNENRLTRYKGFGAKTQQNVLESIAFYRQNIGHFLYAQVAEIFPAIQQYLEKLFGKENVLLTSDYRRQLPTLEQVAFVINDTVSNIKPKFQTAYPPEIVEEDDNSILYKLTNGLRLKLYAAPGHIFIKQFSTSASETFLTAFENNAPGILSNTDFTSEAAVFEKAGIPYILPCLRETAAIIEKAKNNALPRLIQENDIKGIIHNHSNWSDGINTIEEMAQYLIQRKIEYLVISDHSKTAAYANGLDEKRIKEQHLYIDELNKKLAPFKIFKSIECDILNDGALDYTDDVLSSFDLVIASVHANLYMNETKAMQRLLRAIQNPYTTILGHPTGRLLLSRAGYPIRHTEIIEACAANQVVIEINANPHRLDLDWAWIGDAMDRNVLLSINPDAHTVEGFGDVKYGVLASQKGGLTKAFNLSSFSLGEFEAFLQQRREVKKI